MERDWLSRISVHVDGSASGYFALGQMPADREAKAAYKEVGGALRKHCRCAQTRPANLQGSPRPPLQCVQSLPEKAESFAPLGQTLSGGFFLRLNT
jgi:hypothetical protein